LAENEKSPGEFEVKEEAERVKGSEEFKQFEEIRKRVRSQNEPK